MQELGTGIALDVSANVEQREAQPDTIKGWASLDNDTLKKSMAGALVKNLNDVPAFIIPARAPVQTKNGERQIKFCSVASGAVSLQNSKWMEENAGDAKTNFIPCKPQGERDERPGYSFTFDGRKYTVVAMAQGGEVKVKSESTGEVSMLSLLDVTNTIPPQDWLHKDDVEPPPRAVRPMHEVYDESASIPVDTGDCDASIQEFIMAGLTKMGVVDAQSATLSVAEAVQFLCGITGQFDTMQGYATAEIERPSSLSVWGRIMRVHELAGDDLWEAGISMAVSRMADMPAAQRVQPFFAGAQFILALTTVEAAFLSAGDMGAASPEPFEAAARSPNQPLDAMSDDDEQHILQKQQKQQQRQLEQQQTRQFQQRVGAGGDVPALQQRGQQEGSSPPRALAFAMEHKSVLLPKHCGEQREWISRLGGASMRQSIYELTGSTPFGPDESADAGLDLLALLGTLYKEVHVAGNSMGWSAPPASWAEAASRVGELRRVVQTIRAEQRAGLALSPMARAQQQHSGQQHQAQQPSNPTMYVSGLQSGGGAKVERTADSASEIMRARACSAEVLQPILVANGKVNADKPMDVNTLDDVAAVVNRYGDGAQAFVHSNGKCLSALSAGVEGDVARGRAWLSADTRAQCVKEVGDAGMREADNAALATKVTDGLVTGSVDPNDVVKLAGGARSSLAFIVTKGGTGSGRRGDPTVRTDYLKGMSWLDRMLIRVLVLTAGAKYLHPSDAPLLKAGAECGLSQLAQDADSTLDLDKVIQIIFFILDRMRVHFEEGRHIYGRWKCYSLVEEIKFARLWAMGPLVTVQQTEEATKASLALILGKRDNDGARLGGTPPAQRSASSPRTNPQQGRGASRQAAATLVQMQSSTAMQPRQLWPPSQQQQAQPDPQAFPPLQSSSSQRRQGGRGRRAQQSPPLQVSPSIPDGFPPLPQQQQQQQQQPQPQLQGQQPQQQPQQQQQQQRQQQQQQPQQQRQPQQLQQQPQRPTLPLGGPSGQLDAINELERRFYPDTPRAQRPCPWKSLFGTCTKRACDKCANGLLYTPAQIRSIEADCSPGLAERIRAGQRDQ